MNRDDDQQLWDLLGKGRAPRVSPFFARNVIREIRQASPSKSGIAEWLTTRRGIALGALAALALTTVTFTLVPHGSRVQNDGPDAVVNVDPQDNDLLADLDDSSPADDGIGDDDDAVAL